MSAANSELHVAIKEATNDLNDRKLFDNDRGEGYVVEWRQSSKEAC